jgi:hypothetical protein
MRRSDCRHCERWVRSVRSECLDHVFIFNERHLAKVLAEYVGYFNACRLTCCIKFLRPTRSRRR